MTHFDMKKLSIYVDLDKTLAHYESKWRAKQIGAPIVLMVENIKKWLAKGHKVTIFTARLSHTGSEKTAQEWLISRWLKENRLPDLPMTAIKGVDATHFIDDKAYHCVPNTGEILNCPTELL